MEYVPPVYNLSEAHNNAVVHFHELMLLVNDCLTNGQQLSSKSTHADHAEIPDTRAAPRKKLIRLTNSQMGELTVDVYDELVRRKYTSEHGIEAAPFLAYRADYHPLRNQARQKLSTLPSHRFLDLASDICYELMRRYPDIKEPELAEAWSEHSDAER